MRRRDFITLAGGAAIAVVRGARAQQPARPTIGFLRSTSRTDSESLVAAFHRGLGETGFVEGGNLAVEYRFAEGDYDRLPALAADLVRRRVAVIAATGGSNVVLAAKEATSTIPIVYIGGDPIRLGLVASLNRPGGNITGIALLTDTLGAKRLELLHDLIPKATEAAVLVNPDSPQFDFIVQDLRSAARMAGLGIAVLSASADGEIDAAFADLAGRQHRALVVANDPFFHSRRDRLAALAARHAVPAIYEWREFVESGGLMSYGTSITDMYRQAGIYAGRILKGANPAEMPVLQPTTFELVVNLKTAKALGIEIPPSILTRADEVIE